MIPEVELTEIEKRRVRTARAVQAIADEREPSDEPPSWPFIALRLANRDVPKLVAEVRRLEAELAACQETFLYATFAYLAPAGWEPPGSR